MKRIIIITNGTLPVPPVKGGAVENLLQTFIDINERTKDFQLFVFSVADKNAIALAKPYQNTKYIFIASENILYKIGRAVRSIINMLKPNTLSNQFIHKVLKHKKIFAESDLILIENNPGFAKYIGKITNRPIGLHLHNDYLNVNSKKRSKELLDNLNFVVAVSRYIKDRVSEIAPFNCEVKCVYNGLNLNRFCDNNHRGNLILQKKFDIKEGELVILFTGRLQETKGIKILIEAFIEISTNYNAKLLIVGSSGFGGSKKNKFIRQLEELSKSAIDKIIFTGYINYSEIHDIYNLANFAIFPSLAPEAFPLTSIEALASGLPVIITDAGGLPETINEKCGIIIKRSPQIKENLKKQMIRLITDSKLREEMSIEAKKQAQKFDDINYYQSLSSVIKSFI
jgi:glycosyltransferase involved in cell wall biosynthesis